MNREDSEHVLLDGPCMIGDNYLVIRGWIPNFVPEEDKIKKLTAWVRIPKLGVEYFNKHFLLNKIGSKIKKVLKLDSTKANVEERNSPDYVWRWTSPSPCCPNSD